MGETSLSMAISFSLLFLIKSEAIESLVGLEMKQPKSTKSVLQVNDWLQWWHLIRCLSSLR